MSVTSQTLSLRPPIVTFMGHIDHGKTSLMDKIRQVNTWKKEVGGMTQRVSAYQYIVDQDPTKTITFIDTPGHAAFCKMRSRGGQITDIVVLVVSAIDGIMAQTKECIKVIKDNEIPVVVALNKMDVDGASTAIDRVRSQLVEADLTPEEYGGQITCVPVSAKTGQGIDKLIETILLTSEVLEPKTDPSSSPQAFVLESSFDPRSGFSAILIVQDGTLDIGQTLYIQENEFKIKSMTDFMGKPISSASASMPIKVTGFNFLPPVGSQISSTARKDNLDQAIKTSDSTEKKINVIFKADNQGSLEALLGSISDDVNVISATVGPLTDNDIFLAESSDSMIYIFNSKVPSSVAIQAKNRQVTIFASNIIYEIIEKIEKQILKILEPTIDEIILGEGVIKAEFKIDKVRIAGVACTKGQFSKSDQIHLKRDGQIIKNTKIDTLHQGKESVEVIKQGKDFGVSFRPYVDFKINDVIISYKKEKEE